MYMAGHAVICVCVRVCRCVCVRACVCVPSVLQHVAIITSSGTVILRVTSVRGCRDRLDSVGE